jgi:hypothetical protein
MAARILKLMLSRPLVFASHDDGAQDDTIEVFHLADAIRFDEDGPHARSPLPQPFFRGCAMQGIEAMAGADSMKNVAQSDSPGMSDDGKIFTIGSIVHALAQFQGYEDEASSLDAFVRDAWWAGIELCGPLALRRLREDGKDAMQWIAPAAFPPAR